MVPNKWDLYMLTSIIAVILIGQVVAVDMPNSSRAIEIKESDQEVEIFFEMHGAEIVLAARNEDGVKSKAVPCNGVLFPEDAVQMGLRLRVRVVYPKDQEATILEQRKWHIWWETVDKASGMGAAYSVEPEADEQRIPIRVLQVPILVEGFELYLIPYCVVGDNMKFFVIAISDDQQKLRDYIALEKHPSFEWDRSIHRAFTPLHPANNAPNGPGATPQ